MVVVGILLIGALLSAPYGEKLTGVPFALAAIFPFLVMLGPVIGLIFWLDRAGKVVALKRYQTKIEHFVGWKIFWRMWLITVALGIPTSLVFTFIGAMIKLDSQTYVKSLNVTELTLTAISVVIRIFFMVAACGWAFGRILNAAKAKSVDTAAV